MCRAARLLTMPELPVEQDDGCILLRFDRVRDEDLGSLEASVPLTAALVVLWRAGACLVVFNRFRQAWELPGGMLEPEESARDAALRELAEESGQRPGVLDFAGVARVWYAPAERLEHLAIYRGCVCPVPVHTERGDVTERVVGPRRAPCRSQSHRRRPRSTVPHEVAGLRRLSASRRISLRRTPTAGLCVAAPAATQASRNCT